MQAPFYPVVADRPGNTIAIIGIGLHAQDSRGPYIIRKGWVLSSGPSGVSPSKRIGNYDAISRRDV